MEGPHPDHAARDDRVAPFPDIEEEARSGLLSRSACCRLKVDRNRPLADISRFRG